MTYRNDADALRSRADDLSRQLAAVEARLGDAARLAAERVRLRRELEGVRADLADIAARDAPVRLSKLRVARPCRESWDAMQGTDQVRHCARCDKDVFNLSEMTQAEAEALLVQRGVRPCVRFYQRADGTVKTRDCGQPSAIAAGIAAGAFAAAAGVAAAVFGTPSPVAVPVSDARLAPPSPPPVELPPTTMELVPAIAPSVTMGIPALPEPMMGEPAAEPPLVKMGKVARPRPSGGARPRARGR